MDYFPFRVWGRCSGASSCSKASRAGGYHLHRDGVQPAFGDDHIGIAFGRLDKLHVHGADGGEVLVDDHLGRPAALGDVALQAADEADVGVGIDKNLDIEQLAQIRVAKDQDALRP